MELEAVEDIIRTFISEGWTYEQISNHLTHSLVTPPYGGV
jgi:hypothetical protein